MCLDPQQFICNVVFLCRASVGNYFLLFMPSSRKPLAKGLELIFSSVI